ncbi:hypothetical protein KPL44_16740 [Clostridium sp. DSM 17811]|nr:hypothetical protein [Clostridium sp. DSM 17811]
MLNLDNKIIVNAEDLTFAFFAGRQDTYLNIKGENSTLHVYLQ